MTLLKRLLGIDTLDEAEEHAIHRKRMDEALKRQQKASEDAQTTLVDMLSHAAAQSHAKRADAALSMKEKKEG